MIAGATAIEKILTAETLERLNSLGDELREMLNKTFSAADVPFKVTGLGSINQIHCTLPKDQHNAAHDLLFFGLLERGFWIAQRGTISLSIDLTKQDVEDFVSAVSNAAMLVKKAGTVL